MILTNKSYIHVPPDDIQTARKADLYHFLLATHPSLVTDEGTALRLKSDHSVYVRKGFPGYIDWATGIGGNPVDFLTKYLNYTFPDAVRALVGIRPIRSTPKIRRPFTLPEPAESIRPVLRYLTNARAFTLDTVLELESRGLLYAEAETNNAVFVNSDRTFCEIRGTNPGVKFCRNRSADPNAFWSWAPYGKSGSAYVCESAIDAVSLALLIRKPGCYCSIAGAGNQKRIKGIKSRFCAVTIAADNDPAGEACRNRNPDCEFLIPERKDWNEDLIALRNELRAWAETATKSRIACDPPSVVPSLPRAPEGARHSP